MIQFLKLIVLSYVYFFYQVSVFHGKRITRLDIKAKIIHSCFYLSDTKLEIHLSMPKKYVCTQVEKIYFKL